MSKGKSISPSLSGVTRPATRPAALPSLPLPATVLRMRLNTGSGVAKSLLAGAEGRGDADTVEEDEGVRGGSGDTEVVRDIRATFGENCGTAGSGAAAAGAPREAGSEAGRLGAVS